MFRLIYFNDSKGYKSIDYKNESGYQVAQETALANDAIIICVVDYYRKSIINKCIDFDLHHDHIDGLIFDPKVMGLYY